MDQLLNSSEDRGSLVSTKDQIHHGQSSRPTLEAIVNLKQVIG